MDIFVQLRGRRRDSSSLPLQAKNFQTDDLEISKRPLVIVSALVVVIHRPSIIGVTPI